MYVPNAAFGKQYSGPGPFLSVKLAGRDMKPGETLDFSSANSTGNLCGVYQYSAAPNTPQGQWNDDNQPINYFDMSNPGTGN